VLVPGDGGEELPVARQRARQADQLAVALLEQREGLAAAEHRLGRLWVAEHRHQLRGSGLR